MSPAAPQSQFRSGITVIMATYRGEARIGAALTSLARQTLGRGLFEVVVVINGPDEGTSAAVSEALVEHPALTVRVLTSDRAGASAAWELGIAAAECDHLTFVDDDDTVSPDYLAGLWRHRSAWSVVVASIGDVAEDGSGEPNWDNYLQRELDQLSGRVDVAAFPRVLAYHGGKLVRTRLARQVPFDLHLSSGMDVVYWTELIGRFGLDVAVVPHTDGAHYYRSVRPGSMGRSIDRRVFAEERIAVLRHLSRQRVEYPGIAAAIGRNMIGQMHYLGMYLDLHPEQRQDLLERVIAIGDPDMPFESLTRNRSRDLAVVFAFPPFVDTSANVAARRLHADQRIFDVVTMDLAGVRSVDPDSRLLVAGLVDHLWVVRGNVRFSSWNTVRTFVNRGLEFVEREIAARGEYRSVYSRSNWPASHFLAAMLKLQHPATRWCAEFSDPLSRTVTGDLRPGQVLDDELLASFDAALRNAGFSSPGTSGSMFEWCEQVAYAFADEVLFTNPLQRELMAGQCADDHLREVLLAKATVAPHPTLPPVFYGLRESDYPLDPARINIGYFGAFYVSRGLPEVTAALAGLPGEQRRRIQLHVFTETPEAVAVEVSAAGLSDVIAVNSYVPYLEFLALTRRFDVLLVNDAQTARTHPMNPYLPSKISDYLGSGSPVWALTEPGSMLSTYEVAYRSHLGDVAGATAVLASISESAQERAD